MGGRSSSSSSSATQNFSSATDNRQVLGEGAIGATAGGMVSLSSADNRVLTSTDARSFTDSRDQSTNLMVNDSSNRSTSNSTAFSWSDGSNRSVNDSGNTSWSDGSNRSVNNSGNTTTSTTTVDPGALRSMELAVTNNRATTEAAFNFARISQDNSLSTASGLADKSLNLIASSNATLGQGFSALLSAGKSMFESNVNAVNNLGAATAQAYRDATADKSGGLDNKTILLLGVAAIAAFALKAR